MSTIVGVKGKPGATMKLFLNVPEALGIAGGKDKPVVYLRTCDHNPEVKLPLWYSHRAGVASISLSV